MILEQTVCWPRPVRSATVTSFSRCPPAVIVSYVEGPNAGPCVAVAPVTFGLVVAADTLRRSARQRKHIRQIHRSKRRSDSPGKNAATRANTHYCRT